MEVGMFGFLKIIASEHAQVTVAVQSCSVRPASSVVQKVWGVAEKRKTTP
jgi:hypothetical protein